jgi:putative mycofactocin binding protein MftB
MMQDDKRYRLAHGTQVRDEDFGLLFYTMEGPRLFFVTCGELLESRFFDGNSTLSEWASTGNRSAWAPGQRIRIEKTLRDLVEKRVIREC